MEEILRYFKENKYLKDKTVKKNYTVTLKELELARYKSSVKYGQQNVSGYIRGLIRNDETYKNKQND